MSKMSSGEGVQCSLCGHCGYYKYGFCKKCRERSCVVCGKMMWPQDMSRVLCTKCTNVKYGRKSVRTKLERFNVG